MRQYFTRKCEVTTTGISVSLPTMNGKIFNKANLNFQSKANDLERIGQL